MKPCAGNARPRFPGYSTTRLALAVLAACVLIWHLPAFGIYRGDSEAREPGAPDPVPALRRIGTGPSITGIGTWPLGSPRYGAQPELLLKVKVSSPEGWKVLRSLGAELYLRGDGYAVVRLHPEDLPSLSASGLSWRELTRDVPGPLFYLMPERGATPIGTLDVLVLDDEIDGMLVSASRDAIWDARRRGYKAMPLERPWPMRPAGFVDPGFIREEIDLDSEYERLLRMVSQDTLASYIKHLEDYGTRFTFSPQIVVAGEWLLKTLWSYGYTDTVFQPVGFDGKVQIAPGNVMVTKPGSTRPEFYILVGGHYDSIVSGAMPSKKAPGADDNASGTAAALEMARILSNVPLDASVQFVFFTAEEQGLLGALQYVTGLVRDEVPPDKLFFINMDMIATSITFPWRCRVFYDELSLPLAQLLVSVGQAYTQVTPVAAGYSGRSDHVPFQQAGYPAIFVHEWDPSPEYHTIYDLLENLEMDYMTEVVRAIFATVLHLANLADPPDVVTAAETESGDLLVEWNHSADADVIGYHLEILDSRGELLDRIFTRETHYILNPDSLQAIARVRVRAEDVLGEGAPSEAVLVSVGSLLAGGPTPNPTSGRCTFDIFIPGTGPSVGTSVRIVDAAGRLVQSLHEDLLSRGAHTIEWDGSFDDGSSVPPGIYFYLVEVDGLGQDSGKIMVVR